MFLDTDLDKAHSVFPGVHLGHHQRGAWGKVFIIFVFNATDGDSDIGAQFIEPLLFIQM